MVRKVLGFFSSLLVTVTKSRGRWLLLVLLDAFIAAAGLWLSFWLRFELRTVPTEYQATLPLMTLLLVLARLSANFSLSLHRWSFRSSGLTDGARLVLAGILGSAFFVTEVYLLQHGGPPRSVLLMEFFFSTAGFAALRFSPRLGMEFVLEQRRSRSDGFSRTLIIGAGTSGEMLLRDLLRSPDHRYHVVGFVDDDATKVGTIIQGRRVLGTVADLPALSRKLGVKQVLIAIPQVQGKRLREILALCVELKLRFKILPVSYHYLDTHGLAARLQDVSPEDLLPRPEASLWDVGANEKLEGRRVLVTGAAGSIGAEICRQVVEAGAAMVAMVDINENELYLSYRRLVENGARGRVVACVADVRDEARMRSLLLHHRPQDVFHAAAHKHVPLMEEAPCEAVKNNVLGTLYVARAARDAGVERFVFISTDKAVRPTSVMGASKRVGELIVRALNRDGATRFSAVRFGNVLGSAGSVVPLFLEQITRGGPVTVTHPEVKRYFMSLKEAVSLVLQAAYGDYGELLVLEMGEQIRILDLAKLLIGMAGLVPEVDIPIVFTGLRPGEKLAEELMTEEEEVTRKVHRQIIAVHPPAPPADLFTKVSDLAAAAERNDGEAVRRLLQKLVPSYNPLPPVEAI
jgi:FlaA1/EpsC-like NDP-sugar epimerase